MERCGVRGKNGKKCKRVTGGGPCYQHGGAMASGRTPGSPKKSPQTPGSSFLDLSPGMAPSVLPRLLTGTPPKSPKYDPWTYQMLPPSPGAELYDPLYSSSSSSSDWESPPSEQGFGGYGKRFVKKRSPGKSPKK